MYRRIIFFGLAVLGLAACGGNEPPTIGTPTEFVAACNEENDGERIAVQGYLMLPDSFTGEDSVVLRMYESPDYTGQPVGVQIDFGGEANQVDMIPTSYTDEDLNVHLSDGQTAGFGTRVTVSGDVYYPGVEQDFVCGLENPLVELAN